MLRICLTIICAAAIATGSPGARADVVITDYFSNGNWNLFEQADDGLFSQCLAKKLATENNTRLQIGRSMWGDDFVLVYGINNLVEPDQTKGKGRILINGTDAFDYDGMSIYDSVAEPGSKYISIFLANGFIEKLAAANFLVVEFAKGRVKHGLKGSKSVIEKIDGCMDSGLARDGGTTPIQPAGTTSIDIDNMAGSYLVRGRNPNGKYYYGTAGVNYLPGLIEVKWLWTDKTESRGTITTTGNVAIATIEGLNAPAIYTIGNDGIWRGTWSNGQGSEIMVPKPK